jgi:hypothetical protein
MNGHQFSRAIHLGLGRAVLHARNHDVGEFRDVILDACVHCHVFDPQCEGTRAAYMLDLLEVIADKQFYCEEVLKSLPGCGDDWDAVQRFHFAACLAREGFAGAKRAMYESYRPGPTHGESIAIDFVEVDGVEGMLFAVEKLSALAMAEGGNLDLGYLLSQSIELCGEQETLDALRAAGQQNPQVEAYRLAAGAERERWATRDAERDRINALSYEQLRREMPTLKRYRLWAWGKHANESDLQRAAQGLMGAQGPADQQAHLQVFGLRRFPLDHSILLQLAASDQTQVAAAATKALSHIAHPSLRELALRLVRDRLAGRRDAIELLGVNFQPGDHGIVLGWFEGEDDPEVVHSMGMDLEDFWDHHPDDGTAVRMLCALYEKGPCSFCRGGAVRRLIERGALSDAMREECAWDANEDIRKLVASHETGDASPS